jgi:hypothetical protein
VEVFRFFKLFADEFVDRFIICIDECEVSLPILQLPAMQSFAVDFQYVSSTGEYEGPFPD